MIADFQQWYGIALPLDGEPDDLQRMALLWSQLPPESRTARDQAPALEWGTEGYLLWRLEFEMRQLLWALDDPKKRGPEPKPLQTPGERAEAFARRDRALAAKGRIDEILGMEVDDG